MRTTIACERCRRSKVKCAHDGHAPCRGCIKSNNETTCILSGTVTTNRSSASKTRRQLSFHTVVPPRQQDVQGHRLGEHFARVDSKLFTAAIAIFRTQFPEHGFLHPLEFEQIPESPPDDEKLRLLAILVIAFPYLAQESSSRRIDHAAVVIQELQRRITDPPSLSLIQAFLLLALYEWGEGAGHDAWIYAGLAIRLGQVYRAAKVEADREWPRAGFDDPSFTENEVRTIWACFIMDKLLSCGRQRPTAMRLEDMDVRLPQSDIDFVFGNENTTFVKYTQLAHDSALRKASATSAFHFRVIIRGLDLWAKIHSWVVDGGRRQLGMTEPHNCPWVPGSKWALLKAELREWRDDQEMCLRYPETKVVAHSHFRHAEMFGYVNLIYYLCDIFLRREFIPFLPISESEPRGPTDPPFYQDTAPKGWWLHNCQDLSDSAAQMTYLMRDMKRLDASIRTPFTAICAFTAAMMNMYAASFPFMNRVSEASMRRQLATENIDELKRIAKLWKVGEEGLQVISIAHSLHSRAKGEALLHRSREFYPELENRINLAPINGPYTPEHITPIPIKFADEQAPCANSNIAKSQSSEAEVSKICGQPPAHEADPCGDQHGFDVFETFDAEIGGEDWRLWSFWDDARLLSFDNSTVFDHAYTGQHTC